MSAYRWKECMGRWSRVPIKGKERDMDNIWKYKIEVKDTSIFDEIGNMLGVNFPDELKCFISENNAATPAKYKFMLGSSEKALGAVLSFNKGEADVDTVFSALNCIEDKNLIPFAIDPFGNYICYAVDNSEVVFWEHEADVIISSYKTLSDFVEGLYE